MPKLSIITVNLNNCNGLLKTIESVTDQTFQDYAYLVIDGGSTDGSMDVVKRYSSKIAYSVSERDKGVYHAMNKGIREATGEYLLFLNSGDFFVSRTALQEVFLQPHHADILTCQSNITSGGAVVHTTNPPPRITFGTLYETGLCHQSTLIRKTLFDRVGLYDENFKYNADIEFWFRSIILNNAMVEKIPVILCNYNLEGMSTLHSNTEAFKSETKRIFDNPLFQKFIPDYEAWRKEREEMKPLRWVKSKKILYLPLLCIYKLALRFALKMAKIAHRRQQQSFSLKKESCNKNSSIKQC